MIVSYKGSWVRDIRVAPTQVSLLLATRLLQTRPHNTRERDPERDSGNWHRGGGRCSARKGCVRTVVIFWGGTPVLRHPTLSGGPPPTGALPVMPSSKPKGLMLVSPLDNCDKNNCLLLLASHIYIYIPPKIFRLRRAIIWVL